MSALSSHRLQFPEFSVLNLRRTVPLDLPVHVKKYRPALMPKVNKFGETRSCANPLTR